MGPSSYSAYHSMDDTNADMGYRVTVPGPGKRPRLDNGLLPAIEHAGLYNTPHPVSAASSVAGDSPTTLVLGEADQTPCRENGRVYFLSCSLFAASDMNTELLNYNHVHEPDRTMMCIHGDEQYSPNFVVTTTSPPHHPSTSDVFSQCSDAANIQRLSAAHSPTSTGSEAPSPFRIGSPFATQLALDLDVPQQFNFPWQVRERDQHRKRLSDWESAGEPATPKAISPKDAVREYSESEADKVVPLFAQDCSSLEVDSFSKTIATSNPDGASIEIHSKDQFSYIPFQTPPGVEVLEHYPFISRHTASHNSPLRLSSSEASSVASGGNTSPARGKPASTGAESGTYTCTYHGCTLRLQTPTLLKKHKREGHRQTPSRGVARAQDMGMTATFLSTQAGPHRCDRINPFTGNPCNTMFSRPYDLTRHEDTIHNLHKQKVRCNICMEEKTFSRADALTRHYRVCHPDTALPSKNRGPGTKRRH